MTGLVSGLAGGLLAAGGLWVSQAWTKRRPAPWALLLFSLGGLALSWPLPLGQVPFVALLLTVSLIDLHRRIIPNKLVLLGLALGTLTALGQGQLLPALLGGLFAFTVLFALAWLTRGGLGMGDVKLAAVIGLYTADISSFWLTGPLLALVLAFVLSAAVSLFLLLFRLVGPKDYIPFGPFLAAGSLTAIYCGSGLLQWWFGG